MYKQSVIRSLSSPPPTPSGITVVTGNHATTTHPDSSSGSHFDEAPRIFDHRFPSRFRPSALQPPRSARGHQTEPAVRRESSVTRNNEVQIQRLKNLTSELQAKLQIKNQENNQLKLELSRLKTDHERALRQAMLQQKTATEQMVRTLKHAEDIIKEKEKVIRRQEEVIRKSSMLPMKTPVFGNAYVAPAASSRQAVRTPPTRHRSFHGPTRSGEVSASSPTSFRRTTSLRAKPAENDQNVNPLSGKIYHREIIPSTKVNSTHNAHIAESGQLNSNNFATSFPAASTNENVIDSRPVNSSNVNILDLSEKSLWLRQRSRPAAEYNDLKANRQVQRKLTTLPDTDGYRSHLEMVL